MPTLVMSLADNAANLLSVAILDDGQNVIRFVIFCDNLSYHIWAILMVDGC